MKKIYYGVGANPENSGGCCGDDASEYAVFLVYKESWDNCKPCCASALSEGILEKDIYDRMADIGFYELMENVFVCDGPNFDYNEINNLMIEEGFIYNSEFSEAMDKFTNEDFDEDEYEDDDEEDRYVYNPED